jgi:hypothetical protein
VQFRTYPTESLIELLLLCFRHSVDVFVRHRRAKENLVVVRYQNADDVIGGLVVTKQLRTLVRKQRSNASRARTCMGSSPRGRRMLGANTIARLLAVIRFFSERSSTFLWQT